MEGYKRKQGRLRMANCQDYEAMAKSLRLRSFAGTSLPKHPKDDALQSSSEKSSEFGQGTNTKRVEKGRTNIKIQRLAEKRWRFIRSMIPGLAMVFMFTVSAIYTTFLSLYTTLPISLIFLSFYCWRAYKSYKNECRVAKVLVSPKRKSQDQKNLKFRPLWNCYKSLAVGRFEGLKPEYEVIDGTLFPEPMRKLLVHTNNMTPTLAHFHNAKVDVRILDMTERDMVVSRSIVLYVNEDKIIELGAINIYLENMLNEKSRADVRGGKIPFGTILANRKIRQQTGKQAFFVVKNDPLLTSVLDIEEKIDEFDSYGYLYGRCNTILNHLGNPMCEVVEILPFETRFHPAVLIAEEAELKENH